MSEAQQEFEKLQKLLKLKRYEQPPPGYFNGFSTNVINRLEREARNDTWGSSALLKRFFAMLETNPVAAGLFGMSVCGLLVSGIAYSQSRPAPDFSASADAMTVDVAANSMQSPQAMKTASVDSLSPSVSAVFDTNGATAFDGFKLPTAERVNFQVAQ